jgi:hypothetical protein
VAAVDDIGDDVAVSNTVSIQNGVVTGNPSGGDANFSNVVLLMHGDGANNGTIFTDSSFYNHLLDSGIALAPKPYTQTSVVKFGTAAIYTPPDANGMGMGSSIGGGIPGTEFSIANTAIDFTVECFFRQVAWDGTKSPTLFVLGCSPGAQIYMFLSNAGAGVNFLRAFGGPGNGDVWDTYSLPKPPITNNVWHYATLMRKTNVYYLYLDGTLLGSVTPIGSLPSPLTSLAVGSSLTTNNVDQVYIDELRYTVGVARYPLAGPIPIPTAPFSNY